MRRILYYNLLRAFHGNIALIIEKYLMIDTRIRLEFNENPIFKILHSVDLCVYVRIRKFNELR